MPTQNTSLDTLIKILIDSQRKKFLLLEIIEKKTKEQEILLKRDNFTIKEWDTLLEEKDKLIQQIPALDRGFETLYNKIRVVFMEHKNDFKEEIKEIQSLIQNILEKSSTIQALEERNKTLIDQYFKTDKRMPLRQKPTCYITNSYTNATKNRKTFGKQIFDAKK